MSTPLTIDEVTWALWTFYKQADEDYLVARWAFQSGLVRQFAWSAQQALEKYMKCALLLNGVNVQKQSHQLTKLFDVLRPVAEELVPEDLCLPLVMTSNMARDYSELFSDCILRFNENGSPDNRYRYFGLTIRPLDLHRFDEMCFLIRRLCCVLDAHDLDGVVTNRSHLRQKRNFQHPVAFAPACNLRGPHSSDLTSVLAYMNFSFFPDEAVANGWVHAGEYSDVSPVQQHLEWMPDIDQDQVDRDTIEWILSRAKVSPSGETGIRERLGSRPIANPREE